MKAMMASLSFDRNGYGYSVHAEEDKIFVLRREYDEHTGEVSNVVGTFDCGTTISEVKKLLEYFARIGFAIVHSDSDPYDPNVTSSVMLDDLLEGEVILNETSNTMAFSMPGLFVQFGLDEEPEEGDEPYTPPLIDWDDDGELIIADGLYRSPDERLLHALFGDNLDDEGNVIE